LKFKKKKVADSKKSAKDKVAYEKSKAKNEACNMT
jgi:hypothetical protein